MDYSFGSRIKHAWNAFFSRDPTYDMRYLGSGYVHRPDQRRSYRGLNKTILTAIENRIAVDAASIDIRHIRVDEDGFYLDDIDSELNDLFNLEGNIDQSGTAFKHDIYLSMLEEGSIAVAPIITDGDPDLGTFKIFSARVGRITEWFPRHVRVDAYDERDGRRKELVCSKSTTMILENPFYDVMNGSQSIVSKLNRKLALLDAIDEQSGSGKLDLIIQLPYVVKTDARREMAEKRRAEIEMQLTGSKYGIAYTDGTERITQLNRPVENNLMKQVEYLTSMLYDQLGITPGIMNGSASESEMNNYYSRTIEPLVRCVTDECKRKFLTKTARAQRQSVEFFRDYFKLVTIAQLAEISDKFTRNEIASSNNIRQMIGWKPSKDPRADELRNKNISEPSNTQRLANANTDDSPPEEEIQNE